jgi:hypothetical protein
MKLISTQRPPLALSALMIALALLLPACGGGGGGSATSATSAGDQAAATTLSAQTAVYFTDDFSAAYDAVWISVTRITVLSPAGETELMRYDTPHLLNLPTLRRSGALMATGSVPLDATELRVYVSGSARLQQLDGSMLDVGLQAPAGYLGFRLDGWDSRSGALALDFDLPNFSLQGSTLVAATRLADSTDLAGWNSRHTEVTGKVTAVSASRISVQTTALGSQTFALDAQTTYLSERSAAWLPVVGSVVELYSSVTGQGSEALQFSARQVKDRSAGASAGSAKVHGLISAVDNGVVTLSVDRSSLVSATGSISIDVSQASYKRGSAALLAPGMRIEAYLVPASSGTGFSASVLEIEGAAKSDANSGDSSGNDSSGNDSHSSSSNDSHSSSYGEVKGLVSSVNGQQVVLTALYAKHLPLVLQGSALTLDLTNAYFERGGLSCLVAGTPIEVKGAVNAAGQLQAVKVAVEGGCASANPVSDSSSAAESTAPVAGAPFVEAKGLVTALRTGEFDLQVYKIEVAGAAPSTLTVRHGVGTLFGRLSAAQLAVGQFVEIKGQLQGALLDASKVELD